jgi:hypothetical protein
VGDEKITGQGDKEKRGQEQKYFLISPSPNSSHFWAITSSFSKAKKIET